MLPVLEVHSPRLGGPIGSASDEGGGCCKRGGRIQGGPGSRDREHAPSPGPGVSCYKATMIRRGAAESSAITFLRPSA